MNDIAVDFINKIFGKKAGGNNSIIINGQKVQTNGQLSANAEPYQKLQRAVDIEQSIIENKIKLKALKTITDDDLDKAFKDLKIDEIITSTLLVKIAESVKKQAYYIVDEALEDLEDNYEIKRAIKNKVVNTITGAFK